MKEERVKIKNSKGQNLALVINTPDLLSDKLAILCAGFLDNKNYMHLAMLGEELVKKGFTVVRFDPTGTWESDGDISEYLTSQYLNDIKRVLEHMLTINNFSYIILGGHSRGAMVSVLYGAKDSRISLILSIMPYSSKVTTERGYEDWQKNGYRSSTRDIPNSKEIKEFKVPYLHVLDRKQFDIFKEIKKVHVPIIIVAGELDSICLPEDVKNLFNEANEPKKFILMENIGHDYRHDVAQIKKVNEEIIATLEML